MLSLESTSSRMSNLARQEIYFGRQLGRWARPCAASSPVTTGKVHRLARELLEGQRVGAGRGRPRGTAVEVAPRRCDCEARGDDGVRSCGPPAARGADLPPAPAGHLRRLPASIFGPGSTRFSRSRRRDSGLSCRPVSRSRCQRASRRRSAPAAGWRSGTGLTLLNSPGTVDSDYRGEIGVIVINLGDEPVRIRRGDRIAQLVVQRLPRVSVLEEVGSALLRPRGSGGFGHTGDA